MADQTDQANAVPPLPPKGEIVSNAALLNTQIALYRNTLAFGGTRDPSMIWSSMVRDDGSAMIYYRELELKDTDVANALDTLKVSVKERNHSVKPFDDSSQAAEVAAFVTAQLEGLPDFDLILDNMLDAPGYGFSIGEMMFDTSMGQASLLDIKDCPQELFLFNDRYQPQIGPLRFLTNPYDSTGSEVPESKFLTYSYRPRGRNRMGQPLLRSVFWYSWFKRNMLALWLKYGEKGPGTAAVKYQDAASVTQQQQAADIALNIRNSPAFAIPEGMEYDAELLKVANAMDPKVYASLVEAMQLDIVRRILGETLTSFGAEKGKGTQALGTVHSDTLEKKAITICKALAGVINQQLVRPLVMWNFGPQAPMPKWGWEVEQTEDLDKKLDRDATLQGMGLPYSESYLRKTYEIPAPEPGDVIVSKPQAPVMPLPDAQDVTFAERERRLRNQGAADEQLDALDKLIVDLQNESKSLLSKRVREVVDAVQPAVR
jgi:phage gp29-like protein